VLVVGGGIVGVTAAFLLAEGGVDVVLAEAGTIAGGTTGHTTAKLSSLQGLMYSSIESVHGRAAGRAYAELNESGLELIAGLVDRLQLACDFERRPNFIYTVDATRLEDLSREAEKAVAAGLDVSSEEAIDLPFEVAGALRLGNQAQFHPVDYVRGLADRAADLGARIHEGTAAVGASFRSPYEVDLSTGATVIADHVIVATHMPFLDRGGVFARATPYRSYALTITTAQAVPQGMYLSIDQPTRTIRRIPSESGDLVLVGGGSHKTGTGSPVEQYDQLMDFASKHFGAQAVTHRWSAQDPVSADHLPMIGPLVPGSDRMTTATAFSKWGLAAGAAGARLLADAVLGQDGRADWGVFTPARLKPRALPSLIRENVHVAGRLVGDRLKGRLSRADADTISELLPGEGRLLGRGAGQVAAARDDAGQTHLLSARCTHLGCIVEWNAAEKSWDCPCHASRFGVDGRVLEGPAVAPLKPVD
jgi:glycine/D-amino acid oxidase-like deaminating enzyme/nitrite reductase/ring-hydroxylating ferredoxin subunit